MMMFETLYQCHSPWRGENIFERLMEEVAQHDIAVMVEAAGHEASVCQHTYLLDKRLAEHLSSLDVTFVFLAVACFLSFFFVVEVGSLELSVKLQVEIVAEAESVGTLFPRLRHVLLDEAHHLFVLLVHASLVP